MGPYRGRATQTKMTRFFKNAGKIAAAVQVGAKGATKLRKSYANRKTIKIKRKKSVKQKIQKAGRANARGVKIGHSDLKVEYNHNSISTCLSITNVPLFNCTRELIEHSEHETQLYRDNEGLFRFETTTNNGKNPDNMVGTDPAGTGATIDMRWPEDMLTHYSPIFLPAFGDIGNQSHTIDVGADVLETTENNLAVQSTCIREMRRMFKYWRVPMCSINMRFESGKRPNGWYRVFEGMKKEKINYQDNGTLWTETLPISRLDHTEEKFLGPLAQIRHLYGNPSWYSDDAYPGLAQSYPSEGYFPRCAGERAILTVDPESGVNRSWTFTGGQQGFQIEAMREDPKWRRIPQKGNFKLELKLNDTYIRTDQQAQMGLMPIVLFVYDSMDQYKDNRTATTGTKPDPASTPSAPLPPIESNMSDATMLVSEAIPSNELLPCLIARTDILYCVDFKTRAIMTETLPTSTGNLGTANPLHHHQ